MMSENTLLEKIQNLFLSSDAADVWFIFDEERLAGHKFILSTMSPWFNVMFNGSLPEGEEVDMTNSGVSITAFKEFLRFLYTQKTNFTMENIEEIIDLAKQSLS